MDSIGDENSVEARRVGAADIGFEPVADNQHAQLRAPGRLRGKRARRIVNRPMRLSVVDRSTAELLVKARQGACTPDKLSAPLDHDVGIDAEKQKLSPAEIGEQSA